MILYFKCFKMYLRVKWRWENFVCFYYCSLFI